MRGFISGLLIGMALAAATPTLAASIIGGNDWLFGWEVTRNGHVICEDPFIWKGIREIECD